MEEIKLVVPYQGINEIVANFYIIQSFIQKEYFTIHCGCGKLGIEWVWKSTRIKDTVIGIPEGWGGLPKDMIIKSYKGISHKDKEFYTEENLRGIISDIQMVLDATASDDIECSFRIEIVDNNKKMK